MTKNTKGLNVSLKSTDEICKRRRGGVIVLELMHEEGQKKRRLDIPQRSLTSNFLGVTLLRLPFSDPVAFRGSRYIENQYESVNVPLVAGVVHLGVVKDQDFLVLVRPYLAPARHC